MKHGSRALRAMPTSRQIHELRLRTLYGPEVQALYGVEIQGGEGIDPTTERRSS